MVTLTKSNIEFLENKLRDLYESLSHYGNVKILLERKKIMSDKFDELSKENLTRKGRGRTMKTYRRIKPIIKAAQYKGNSYSDAKKFCKENGIDDNGWAWAPVSGLRIENYSDVCGWFNEYVKCNDYVVEGEYFETDGCYEVYSESEFISSYEKVEAENG